MLLSLNFRDVKSEKQEAKKRNTYNFGLVDTWTEELHNSILLFFLKKHNSENSFMVQKQLLGFT